MGVYSCAKNEDPASNNYCVSTLVKKRGSTAIDSIMSLTFGDRNRYCYFCQYIPPTRALWQEKNNKKKHSFLVEIDLKTVQKATYITNASTVCGPSETVLALSLLSGSDKLLTILWKHSCNTFVALIQAAVVSISQAQQILTRHVHILN